MQKLPAARHARVAALFVSVLGLAACGGGGGGGADDPNVPPPPPPPPSTSLSLAECTALPAAGLSSEYLNGAVDTVWGKRVWQAAASAAFPDATHARLDYATAGAAQPAQIWYYKSDAGTRTVLGYEVLNGGTVQTRTQFVGWVESKSLAAGASETIDYTVRPLLPASADRSERLVRTFTASQEATLPGGRVDTCVVDTVLSRQTGGTLGEHLRERQHYAPGFGVVKRYLTHTHMSYVLSDRNQTYMNELVASSAAVPYVSAAAGSTPALADCARIAGGQLLEYTASNRQEALSDKRRTLAGSFMGAPSVLVSQRSRRSDLLSKISYFDASLGALRERGYEIYNSEGTSVTSTTTFSGRPDLSGTAVGGSVNYTQTSTTDGTPATSNDSFTFVGHEKVATPAGDFDTCKLHFDYGSGDSETYYVSPDTYWVRLDAVVGNVRTTRELIQIGANN